MPINIPETKYPRIVIVGAGFAGINLAQRLSNKQYQIVIIDRNNFHQFQPLLYQVAMSGIEPSSIAFPLRRLFSKKKNIHIRVAELLSVNPEMKNLTTSEGLVNYDILVLATGVTTNYYGNTMVESNVYSLKSVADALFLRNAILSDLEKALTIREDDLRQSHIDMVIVGGGPTGVEMAGSLAEMKKFILPHDYPELNAAEMDIYLIEGSKKLLASMSEEASEKSKQYLEKMGVQVMIETRVTNYDGNEITLSNGSKLYARKVIWAAGIIGKKLDGIPETSYAKGNRIMTNEFNQVKGLKDIYAIGDNAYMEEGKYKGHPQVAQPAIQEAKQLAKNLNSLLKGKQMASFKYHDLGSLATIGRNKAVADLPFMKTQGFIAWILWLVVHLKSILGVKNQIFVFLNWVWSYITMDQSLRIIVKHKTRNSEK
ncbi:MAG: NAD(P)/FAD-dependent oxidoreductase [Saprospiraceae bacterium]|uniref:NADH:ubiquinone reductase (non-electrogenic) n=1 Tax=Candidatus Opimibacter skivensis TaxID=2982028 RepID=A0A9D7T280_9BACT|nr:NAD(P)/FAD-dependent oxidoreductase [Candidatus Opimibacter skivensis]